MRLFFAIELPAIVTEQMARLQRELERVTPARMVRWVKPDRAHLTLRFLGETSPPALDAILQAMSGIDWSIGEIPLVVAGLGCFPRCSKPRVVWLGVEDRNGMLDILVGRLEAGLATIDIPMERRPFTPHLTLGRVQRRGRAEERESLAESLGTFDVNKGTEFRASELVLFESKLLPGGAEYRAVARYPF